MSSKTAGNSFRADDAKADSNRANNRDVFDYGNQIIHLSMRPYWCLVAIRFILACVPQTGYIHPDEFFQTVEVMNGDIFGYAAKKTWEFDETQPVRSITVIYLFFGIPLYLLKLSSGFILNWFSINVITPYFLLVTPRLAMCCLSFINDFCLYKICYKYAHNYRSRLFLLASSCVMLIYGSRTFSNTVEMYLFSLLIYFVADSMTKSDRILQKDEYYRKCYNATDDLKEKVKFHRMRLALPWHMFSGVFFISNIVVLGVFNRPTFLAYACPPLFFWLLRGLGSPSVTLGDFHMRTLLLIVSGVPGFITIVMLDSIYYGYLSIEDLFARQFDILHNFVVTPYNFILYNMNQTNLADHGIHNRFTHILVNIPLLFNVLGIVALCSFLDLIYKMAEGRRTALPRIQSILAMMTASWVIPLIALSLIPHQEPRFLLPCILPLIFLHGQRIRTSKLLVSIWYTVNVILIVHFGFLQQAGIYPVVRQLNEEAQSKPRLTNIHLVTSHIYLVPQSLLQVSYGPQALYTSPTGTRYQKTQDVFMYELGSSHFPELTVNNIIDVQSECEKIYSEKKIKYRLYLAIPTSRLDEFRHTAFAQNVSHEVDVIYYPHISTEAMPQIDHRMLLEECMGYSSDADSCSLKTSNSLISQFMKYFFHFPVSYVTNYVSQLGLAVVHFPRP